MYDELIGGCEVLLCWCVLGGVVLFGVFIVVVEMLDFIILIMEWVLC